MENLTLNCVVVQLVKDVGIVQISRPAALNAMSSTVIDEILTALRYLDRHAKALVITGSEKSFSVGVDVKELKELDFRTAYRDNFLQNLNDGISSIRKPVIAAVEGYALGGGCELAMMCDIIFASENARFGQPEIKIGTIPGAGGTQRLTRAIGKAKAMYMVLTGETMNAQEAEAAGLISKICPKGETVKMAINCAQTIAQYSTPVTAMAKEAVNEAEELALSQGLRRESRLYHSTFSLLDSKEGMRAFVEKRTPKWEHK